MPLSQQQQANIDAFLIPHLEELAQCSNKSQRLQALRLALKPSALSIEESAALSVWKSDVSQVPLLPTVAAIRGLQQNVNQISGIDNPKEAQEYIAHKIKSRIERLKKKDKVKPEVIPELTAAAVAAFTACMSAYLIENIGNALQEAAKTTSSAIHSDNKIIRYAINYAIKSTMNSIMKDRDFINSESAFKTVAGAGAGAIIGSLSPEHEKFAGDIIEGAIDGLADNLGNIKKAIKMASLGATVRSGAALATADSEIFEVAAVGGAKNAVDIPNYIYGSIEKNIYNLAMKAALGDDALKKREVEKYMEAYFLSIGAAQESKKIISQIGNQMAESIHDYLGHEAVKEVDIDRFMLLSSASREIESKYGLANKSIDNRTIPFDIPAPPTSEKDNMYLQPKLPQSPSQPAGLVAGSSGFLGNAPEAIATAAVLAAAVHAAKGIFKKSENNEAVAVNGKKTAGKERA